MTGMAQSSHIPETGRAPKTRKACSLQNAPESAFGTSASRLAPPYRWGVLSISENTPTSTLRGLGILFLGHSFPKKISPFLTWLKAALSQSP